MSARLVDIAGSGQLRLLDAGPADLARIAPFVDVRRQGTADGAAPLLTVRFVDALETGGVRRLVGAQHATDGAAVLMRSGAGWARLPLGDALRDAELVCERGATEVPHLVDLLNLAALQRGALPLHAAALSRDGQGVLLVGWSRGGKTEAVLARTARGDELVGDEWLHLDASRVAHPLGYRLRLWSWQLAQSPDLWARLSRRQRVRLAALKFARRVAPARLDAPLARRDGVYLRPEVAFPGHALRPARIERVVLLESHNDPEVTVRPLDGGDLVERVCASARYERRGLLETYEALRFAVPGAVDSRLEEAAATEHRLATQLLTELPAVTVAHPYPVRLAELADVV